MTVSLTFGPAPFPWNPVTCPPQTSPDGTMPWVWGLYVNTNHRISVMPVVCAGEHASGEILWAGFGSLQLLTQITVFAWADFELPLDLNRTMRAVKIMEPAVKACPDDELYYRFKIDWELADLKSTAVKTVVDPIAEGENKGKPVNINLKIAADTSKAQAVIEEMGKQFHAVAPALAGYHKALQQFSKGGPVGMGKGHLLGAPLTGYGKSAIMAAMAEEAKAAGHNVLVMSPDKDKSIVDIGPEVTVDVNLPKDALFFVDPKSMELVGQIKNVGKVVSEHAPVKNQLPDLLEYLKGNGYKVETYECEPGSPVVVLHGTGPAGKFSVTLEHGMIMETEGAIKLPELLWALKPGPFDDIKKPNHPGDNYE